MDHTEAIVELNNIIEKQFCEEIINYINTKQLKNLAIDEDGNDLLNKNIRNVLGHHLDPKEEKNIFDKINKKIEKYYFHYKAKFPKTCNNKINQIDLLKYEVGGKYEYHVDTFTDVARSISIIINLNNDYTGGNLIFADQKNFEVKRCKLDTGSIVFFPSNFMYPHAIEPITEGTRYSIVAWIQ